MQGFSLTHIKCEWGCAEINNRRRSHRRRLRDDRHHRYHRHHHEGQSHKGCGNRTRHRLRDDRHHHRRSRHRRHRHRLVTATIVLEVNVFFNEMENIKH